MITARDFYNSARERFSLNIVAGEKGLNRPAVWLYLAEDAGSFSFVRGGELSVTTGMSISDSSGLYGFILALINKNTSGLIINTGRYITMEHITGDIIDLCNKNAFLLMTMPWEMHLSDLMQTFADIHFNSRLKEDSLKNALTELCHSPEAAEKHIDFLKSQQLMPSDSYTIGLIKIKEAGRARLLLHSLVTNIEDILILDESPVIMLLHNADRDKIRLYTELICSMAEKKGTDICLATGSVGYGYKSLFQSYAMAEKALKIAEYKGISHFDYELSGMYSVFMHSDSIGSIKRFACYMIGPLMDYDREHDGNLLETLMAYIKYRGSFKAVANNTNCHRNTVAYRIGKIKQILDNDLTDGEYLAELSSAVAAAEYVKIMEG